MNGSMNYFRPAGERGHARFSWLNSYHSFSFGHYYDPAYMGISKLRVINDDTVAPGAGFDAHSHQNMEIISYVLDGAITHADSLGNKFIVPAGDVQRMSAGSGITHSEYNASSTDPLRFLQIWIKPKDIGIAPSYQQAAIVQNHTITPLVTPDGRDGSLMMHQDASLYRIRMAPGEFTEVNALQNAGYLHVINGEIEVHMATDRIIKTLNSGDALGFTGLNCALNIGAANQAVEALWFDLP